MRAWRLKNLDGGAAARLERELHVHAATARCLVARELVDPNRAHAFLEPRLSDLRPPAGMAGFDPAVRRLLEAVRGGETIGIFGDYDVDGVTTTALLTSFLRSVGAAVEPAVAKRQAGYGFSEGEAASLLARGAKLVVTVDCGTSDLDAIARCRAAGVDVIVIDHHQVPERDVHPARALLNPHHPDSTYPFRGLCSVGLGFFVAAALRTALRQAGHFASRQEPDVRLLLDLVAVGTIADMAPLSDENRVLVTAGLRQLGERRRPGLAALIATAGIDGNDPITETDIGWKLAPRLNAPGRLGDSRPALDLLLAPDSATAAAAVAVCDEANVRRREITTRMVEEATEDAGIWLAGAGAAADPAPALVLGRTGWHPGVAGIVAAKLVDRYGVPTAVIAIDDTGIGRGSLRSVGGFDLVAVLRTCAGDLIRYGGHAQAAGVTVAAVQIDALRHAFAAQAAAHASPPAPDMVVDAVLALGECDHRVASQFHALAPFGPGNVVPIVAAAGARVRETRRVGDDGSHLKLMLECGRHATSHAAIAFRMGDRDPGPGATLDVAFCPGISQWRGQTRVELRVSDFRVAAGAL